MLHGETGRYPISIDIKCKMIAFWSRLINGNCDKLSYKMFSLMLNQENANFKWLSKIKQILDSVGLTHFYQDQLSGMTPLNLHRDVKRIYINQYKQERLASVTSSGKGRAYHLFKREPEFEKYFKSLPQSDALEFFKFRTANHNLPIETGRWNGTTLENRKFNICEHKVIGSERHYLLECDYFSLPRNKYLSNIGYNNNEYAYIHVNLTKSTSQTLLSKIARFAKVITQKFK